MMLHDEHLVGAAVEYIRDEQDQRRVGAAPRGRRHPQRVRHDRGRRTCASGAATSSSCSSACCATCSAARPGRCRRRPTRSSSRTTCRRPTPRSSTRPRSPGLITDAGGKTSHTAIIARAHEIPAVVGAREHHRARRDRRPAADRRRDRHRDRQPVGRDGRASTASEQRRQVAAGAQLHAMRDLPARTRDDVDIAAAREHRRPRRARRRARVRRDGRRPVPHRVPVHDRRRAARRGAPLPDRGRGARAARRASRRRSARSTSAPTSSRRSSSDAELDEANPALGLRSIRLCLSPTRPARCSAPSCAACCARRRTARSSIMFPMISGVAELRAVKAVVDERQGASCAHEGKPFDEDVKLGIMIEMPSAALTADLLAQRVRLLLDRHQRPHPVHDGGRSRERVRVVPLRAAAPVADPADRRGRAGGAARRTSRSRCAARWRASR